MMFECVLDVVINVIDDFPFRVFSEHPTHLLISLDNFILTSADNLATPNTEENITKSPILVMKQSCHVFAR